IAANLTARGVANVVSSIADLQKKAAGAAGAAAQGPAITYSEANQVVTSVRSLNPQPLPPLEGYAQISIWEPFLTPDGMMEWKQITQQSFTREVMGGLQETTNTTTNLKAPPGGVPATPNNQAPPGSVPAQPNDQAPAAPVVPTTPATPSPTLPGSNNPGRAAAASGPGGFAPGSGSTMNTPSVPLVAFGEDLELERAVVAGTLGIPNPSLASRAGAAAGAAAADGGTGTNN